MTYPIISRNRDGSIDASGNTPYAGVYAHGRHAHDEPSSLQAKLAASRATREREHRREMADQLVNDGLAEGDEEALSDGLLMRARNVELTDGGWHVGHYSYRLSGDRLVKMGFGLTAAEACYAADAHARSLGLTEPEGPDPLEVSVLRVRDAAQAAEIVQSMEFLGWLRRHVDSPAWAGIDSLSELEDLFEPVALPDA